jgi:hypothetical protein
MKDSRFFIRILPRMSMTRDEFLQSAPGNSIALDGIVLGGPWFEPATNHINFDHHDCVVREATMSTAKQVYFAIKGGLMDRLNATGNPIFIYINDTDQDTALAVWLLKNYKKFEGVQSIPTINRLLELNDRLDITGGAFPMNLDLELVGQHNWVFGPYTALRKAGMLREASEEILQDNLDAVMARLDQFVMNRSGNLPLDTRHKILYDSPEFKIVDEIGGNEARYHLFSKGMSAYISVINHRPNKRLDYTVGKRSRFDMFPVTSLYDDFNAVENRNRRTGFNGSDIIGGSNREHGTDLGWEQIRDITIARLKKDGILS